MEINWTYFDDYFVICTNIKALHCIPKTNINAMSIIPQFKKQKTFIYGKHKQEKKSLKQVLFLKFFS